MAEYIANIRVSASVTDAERAIERLGGKLRALDAATTRIAFPDLTRAANLERTLRTVQQIQNAVSSLGGAFRSISSPGRGDIGDAFGQAAERARRFYNELTTGANALARTTTGLQEQAKAFRTLAANIDSADDRFLNFVQGAQAATDRQLQTSFRQFEALRRLYQEGLTGQGNNISGNQLGANFFAQLRENIPQTTLALQAYRAELQRINNLVESDSLAAVGLEQELLRVERQILDIENDRLATRRAISRELTSEVQGALSRMQGRDANPFGISDEQVNNTLNQRAEAIAQQADETKRLQAALQRLEDSSAERVNSELQARKELLAVGAAEVRQLVARANLLKSMPAGFGISGPRALPSSEMLNANGRGIQQLATAEDRYNNELQESVARLQQVDRLEESRVRRAAKLQSINDYYGTSGTLPGDVGGVIPGRAPGGPAGPARAPRRTNSVALAGGVNRMESLALGVGFPLLFGGGVGSVAGAAAGSFIGSGFGGQILGGAIGQAIDNFILNVTDLAKSLKNPTEALKAMETAGLRVSDSLRYNVQLLTESGRAYEAQRLVIADLNRQLGKEGTQSLFALVSETKTLQKTFDETSSSIRSALIPALVGLIGIINDSVGAIRAVKLPAWLEALIAGTGNIGGRLTDPAGTLAKDTGFLLNIAGRGRSQGATAPALAPEVQDQMRQAQRQAADEIRSAYREGFQLQRAAIDLERQGADLRRRIADDIFNKQQQALRSQIEADRLRRQLAIETVDLEYRRRISNEEGRAAQVLEAEAALMRTRAQGEAELEARRKTLELDIAKQQRDTQNYVYQLSRDIDNIRRSTLQHEMDVADYRLKIERQIQDQRRLDAAASGAAAGVGSSAVGSAGFTANQLTLATREAAKFTGVANMCSESVKAFYKSLGVSLPGVTAWADTVRKAGTVMKDWSKLRPGDIVATGRPGDTTHVGVYTGGNNVFHQSRSRGLVSGNFPDLNYFKQGGYFVRPNATTGNLNNAASAIRRPNVSMSGASGVARTMASLDARDNRIKGEQLALQKQLNKLGEEAAMQRLLEVARGPQDLQQRREAVALAKAELAAVVPGSRAVQERLVFEAQSLIKLQQRRDEDARILELLNPQGEKRKEILAKMAEGLRITEQQIALDREALKLAQDKAYAVERASLESQLGVTGQGRAAGFIGNAAGAYENALMQYGDTQKAQQIATLTQQIDMARLASQGWESSLMGVGNAFSEIMTTGVASMTAGTQSAQQIFVQFLSAVGQALQSAATQMIATYVAIGIARIFAGLGGGSKGEQALNIPDMQKYSVPLPGFRANGGPVTSGAPYIVGERGPELFVPGTGGSVVPTNDLRAAMNSGAAGGGGTPVLNMSFETTSINGVEYVSREQLEAAMAATRRQAARDGAQRGMTMTLDRLQQSPNTRRRVGF